ncbi:MAG: PSD1 and planctomycete cytochrome C domain-containing protein [Planctomycetota bacterium]|nr:PSD1 and planctomycete cytochrome C domain-containing protein [Planctomycetota bacterium]
MADSEEVDFDHQVRPILARYCFPCHGNDGETRKKGLRLDAEGSATAVRKGGLAAFQPGEPGLSLALQRILDDADPMPPDGRERPSAEEVSILTRWIEQGARYTDHWSWRPVEAPAVPQPEDANWGRDPLDQFVRAGLEMLNLQPAADADDRSWLRRVTLDLTGLPASPEQIYAFLGDDSRAARERVVDRLLESSAHAEHFARHWLDLVRYAETHGHEFDYTIPDAWKYRDYVIRAIAADVPIDRFVAEHVAGDLLSTPRFTGEHPTDDSPLATGWWWLNQSTHAPVDVLKDTHDRVDNQIDVISRAFLGATVSCARCHDHKFDGIRQADWTGLSGIVRSTRRVLRPRDLDGKISQQREQIVELRQRLEEAVQQGLEWQQKLPLVALARTARALRQGREFAGEVQEAADIIVADFEQGWGDWQLEGDAFGSAPHTLEELTQGFSEGAQGQSVAISHDRRSGTDGPASDARTGKLTSPPFLVQRDYLLFLVGGGQHIGKTCVNLIIDGESVLSVTGQNQPQLHEVRWDVGQWRGQEAIIEVVDDHDGSWGHIGCDHFRLTDQPVAGISSRGQVERAAQQSGLDPSTLRDWMLQWPQLTDFRAAAGPLEPGDVLLGNFEAPSWTSQWSVVGPAFSRATAGEVVSIGRPRLIDAHCIHSAMKGRGCVGSILSRNFLIEHRFLHLRVQGEQTRVQVVVEGFWMNEYSELLFEGLRQEVNSPDGWSHLQIDLARFQGRNAYLEVSDEGRGWVALDRAWLSQQGAAPAAGPDWSLLDDRSATAVDLLADPIRVEALMRAGLVDLARIGDAWNAAVVRTVQELKDHDSAMPQADRYLSADDAPRGFDVALSIRGDHKQPAALISRRAIENLGGLFAAKIIGSGRFELAGWITAKENPLFWRAQANRLWARVMGVGLAPTSDDLGAMGVPPAMPKLLDHLASRLRDHPSRRALLRSLVLSRTYGMASIAGDPRASTVDPENRHWHRAHQKRLGAEALRDSVLAVSGRLDRREGGASVAVHLTDFLTGRGRPAASGPLDGAGRRSIYIKICRNFLPPFLTAFDFPTPATTVGDRGRTNVPAQALTLMNDPFVHEQARLWGERSESRAEQEGLSSAIEWMWQEAFTRLPTAEESALARQFIEKNGDDGWSDLAHALIQAKEFRFIP